MRPVPSERRSESFQLSCPANDGAYMRNRANAQIVVEATTSKAQRLRLSARQGGSARMRCLYVPLLRKLLRGHSPTSRRRRHERLREASLPQSPSETMAQLRRFCPQRVLRTQPARACCTKCCGASPFGLVAHSPRASLERMLRIPVSLCETMAHLRRTACDSRLCRKTTGEANVRC